MWADGSDSQGVLDFRSLAMDSMRMWPPQQRLESAVPSPQNGNYRVMAAEALQEIRTGHSSKQLHPQPGLPSSPQLQFHQQQQNQQSMHQRVDAPGPRLQLSFSGPQSQMDLGCSVRPAADYCESDLQMGSSSFSLQGMLGRVQPSNPISENNQFFNILQPSQRPIQIQASDLLVQDSQVSLPWFPAMQNQIQTDPQLMATARLGQVDTAPSSQVVGALTHLQNHEVNAQAGLVEHPPLGFSENDQDAEQLQADRSHLLFGVPIDQPLTASASLTSRTFEKTKEQQNGFSGSSNVLQGSLCPRTTPDLPTIPSGVISSGSLDDNGLYQQNSDAWPSMQSAPPLRTFVKVHKLGMPGRSLDIRNFHNYAELCSELACMFNLEGILDGPVKSGWQLVFVDHENDTLLVGDDPWE
jgi:hypothetical protein